MNYLRTLRRILAVVVLGAIASLSAASAQADLASDLQALAAKSFKDRLAAVNAVAAAGEAKATRALEAMLKGRLYTRKADKRLVIAIRTGKVYVLSDPITGEELGQTTKRKLRKVRVNNRLRAAIRGAIGALSLLNPDAGARRAAADAVFKARDATKLTVLETALARETDDRVRVRMELARAAIRATSSATAEVRIDGIRVLSKFAYPDVRALLSAIVADSSADATVREAATEAVRTIEEELDFWRSVGTIFQGISLGSVLLLAAVGLAITFGVMGVINMAHGELVMLGAYSTFVVQQVIRAIAPEALEFSLVIAVPTAFLVVGAFGIAIERCIIRFLYGRPLETLLATWGLSLILQQLVRSVFGPTNREVTSPSWMSGAYEAVGGLVLTYNRIAIIVFALVVLALIGAVMRWTPFGLQVRAVTQNRRMAGSMGIRTGRVDALTFGLGAGIAGVAGVALSQIDNVGPNLGQAYIIDSFMVVVFGGVGNLWGTLVGALSLGVLNKFMEPFTGAVLAKILVLVAIILFIQIRPRGLFALKGRAVES